MAQYNVLLLNNNTMSSSSITTTQQQYYSIMMNLLTPSTRCAAQKFHRWLTSSCTDNFRISARRGGSFSKRNVIGKKILDGVEKVSFFGFFFLRHCFTVKKQCNTECNNPLYYTTEYLQQHNEVTLIDDDRLYCC